MKRVFVFSSHPLFGTCIETLLRQEKRLEIVGRERDPERVIGEIQRLQPDVVIVDSNETGVKQVVATMYLLKPGLRIRMVGLNQRDNTAFVCSGERKIIGELGDLWKMIQSADAPETSGVGSAVQDRYGRTLNYLRVSITDRCNLRCVYCMPPEGIPAKPRSAILHSEEIARIVEAAAGVGFRAVRLTGGEPLVRKGVAGLVKRLVAIPGIEEVALTTNATLLRSCARELADAGLKRVNISLDSLRPDRFRRITRFGNLESVRQGIAAAEAVGLAPLKINMVVVRGFNDDEVADFARLTLEHPWHIRFIEVMPIAGVSDWGPDLPGVDQRLVPVAEIRRRLEVLGPLSPDPGPTGQGPARYYRLAHAPGTIGFISPISEHFCATCNRMRLTADGYLRPCLFSDEGIHVKPALAQGASLSEIESLIRQAGDHKPERRASLGDRPVSGTAMSMIGG